MGRGLNGKKRQEGQEGAKTIKVFLPLLALLVFSCRKTASLMRFSMRMN
jgi:hypothetical protein